MRKNILITILGVLVAGAVFAQNETRKLNNFKSISSSQSINVTLKKGNENTAEITVDNVDSEDVLTEISGEHLSIKMKPRNYQNMDVKVVIVYKNELKMLKASSSSSISSEDIMKVNGFFEARVSSSASIRLNKVIAKTAELSASSSGDMKLGLDVEYLEATASSSGEISAEGTAKKQEIIVSSSGRFKGESLVSDETDVKASSSGMAYVNVNEKLKARASSSGGVRYSGDPKNKNSASSSGGSIKKRG